MKHSRTFSIVVGLIALAAILLMAMQQTLTQREPLPADSGKPPTPLATASYSETETETGAPSNASADAAPNEPNQPNETATSESVDVGEQEPVAFKVTKRGEVDVLQIHVGEVELNETPDGWIPSLEGSDGLDLRLQDWRSLGQIPATDRITRVPATMLETSATNAYFRIRRE